jgi:hypothetical protein
MRGFPSPGVQPCLVGSLMTTSSLVAITQRLLAWQAGDQAAFGARAPIVHGEGVARALGIPMSEGPTNGKDLHQVREDHQPPVGCVRVEG